MWPYPQPPTPTKKILHLKNAKWLVIENKVISSTKYQSFSPCNIATPNVQDSLTYLCSTAVINPAPVPWGQCDPSPL